MLIPIQNIKHVYQHILQKALEQDGNGCTIYIFISNDVDSIASLKILTSLLKSDEVQFVSIPVFSNKDIEGEIKKLSEQTYLRSMVFINCGGTFDFTEQWMYQKKDVNMYLMDYHRPYHHANVNEDQSRVFVVDDGCQSFKECPTAEDDRILAELGDDSEEGDDEFEDSDDFSDMGDARKEAEDLGESGSENCIEQDGAEPKEDDEEGQDDEEVASVGQKRKAEQDLVDQRKLKIQKKMKFQKYYRGTFYSSSTSGIFYQLSSQLNRATKDMLWWWIMGLTDLIVHCRSGDLEYSEEIKKCNSEVAKLHPIKSNQEAASNQIIEDAQLNANAEYKDKNLFDLVTRKTNNQEIGTIMIESELRLMLLRHWTLYDSCKHSNYVVSKLELWKEPGIKRFHHFLAKVGVPLEQAKQKYQYMDPDLKKELKSRILDNSFESSLDKIIMSSYVRQVTEDTQISATDMVYSITSLLEQPAPLEGLESSKKNKNNISSISKDAKDSINLMKNSVAAKKLEEHVQQQVLESLNMQLNDNFWVAYDALEPKNYNPLVTRGIHLAKELQKAIISVGTDILERKEVKVSTYFRYCMLENDYLSEVKLFQYPLALQKLGLFIMEAYQQKKNSQKFKQKPLLMSVKNSKKGKTLVIAIMGHQQKENTVNDFGLRFRGTAEKLDLRLAFEDFESGMLEIDNNNWKHFMQELTSVT